MALKEDRWIRKMALEHDMISPFVDRQISKFSEKRSFPMVYQAMVMMFVAPMNLKSLPML